MKKKEKKHFLNKILDTHKTAYTIKNIFKLIKGPVQIKRFLYILVLIKASRSPCNRNRAQKFSKDHLIKKIKYDSLEKDLTIKKRLQNCKCKYRS